ncbi:MAG: nucleotidyltransferase family protein [Bacteroidota bacterium]
MEKLTDVKAMIFAAGLGTRLRPLTNDRPKALVEVDGISLLEIAIRRLLFFGIKEIVVNIHHFADRMNNFLDQHDFGVAIHRSDESDKVLETGGGLLKAKPFFADHEGPILIFNVDVLTNLDLSTFVGFHRSSGNLATLAVRERDTSRYLHFDENLHLCKWSNEKTGAIKISREGRGRTRPYAFSGIHVIEPQMLDLFTREGKFSIIDTYLDLAKRHPIGAYDHTHDEWLDVGKPEALKQAPDLLEKIRYQLA